MENLTLIPQKYTRLFVTVLAFGVFLTACSSQSNKTAENDSEEVTISKVKQEAKDAVETTSEYAMQEKEEMVRAFETRRDQTKVRIENLKLKLANAKKSSKAKLQQSVDDLQQKQQQLEERISELKKASKSAYDEVSAGVDSAVVEIEMALDEAEKEFKK